jgi:hypothetical protein
MAFIAKLHAENFANMTSTSELYAKLLIIMKSLEKDYCVINKEEATEPSQVFVSRKLS